MARPRQHSRARLQTAALALVDAHGLGGLSMRALATALGTGAMTLYHHVADRADLDVLVVEAVMAEAVWPRRRAADWTTDVRRIATAAWRAVRAHPHAIPLILTRRSRSPAALASAEALLDALARGGKSGRQLLYAFRAVSAYVMGFAQAELAGPLALDTGETPARVIRRIRALPRDRYPRLIALAGIAVGSDAEREFKHGLDILLAGLAGARATKRVGYDRPPARQRLLRKSSKARTRAGR
jgi:AcrR family transcriptional regulator